MIKSSDIVVFLNEIEKRFPIEKWEIDGIKVWPLIRIDLGYKLSFLNFLDSGKEKKNIFKKLILLFNSIISIIRNLFSRAVNFSKEENINNKTDVVFLSDGVSYVKIKGEWFEKYCDSLRIILKEFGICVTNLVTLHKYYIPRFASSAFIQPNIDYAIIKALIKSKLFPIVNNSSLNGYNDFVKFVSIETDNKIELLSIKNLYFKTKKVREISSYYKKILLKLKPKLGISECYYGDYCFAFNLACSELGILSADMQHGVQGDYHIAYGTWGKIPADGYQLLPNIFWCWSESEEKVINKWAKLNSNIHRAMALGNTFNYVWKNSILFKNENQTLIPQFSKNSANILVALQFGIATEENMKEVLKAISLTQNEYNWWIRLHPNMLEDEVRVRKMLNDANIKKYELKLVTSLPLFTILSQANIHLTYSSSTVIESTEFGVPSIITSEYGANIFDEQIKNGWALTAIKSSEILQAINFIVNNKSKFIRTDYLGEEIKRKQKLNELVEIIKG